MVPWRKDDLESLEAAVERAEGAMGPHHRGVLGVVRALDLALYFTRVPICLLCGLFLALLPFQRFQLEVWWLVVATPIGLGIGWFLPELPRRAIVGLGYRAMLAAVEEDDAPQGIGGMTSVALPSPLASSSTREPGPTVPMPATSDPVAGSDEAG